MFPRAGFCFQFLVTKGTDYFSLKSNSLREYNNIFFSAVLGKESHSKRAPSTPSARGSCPQPTAASTWTFSLREMVHHRDRQTDRQTKLKHERGYLHTRVTSANATLLDMDVFSSGFGVFVYRDKKSTASSFNQPTHSFSC